MSEATIYTLCDSRVADPINRVRYVGQTRIALAQRLHRHWITALAGAKEHRAVWMRSVKAAGGDVLITAIVRVPAHEADAVEIEQIARFLALGCDLTNRTDGGRGRRGWTVSAATRQKMRESASRRIAASPATRQKMSAAIRASESHRAHLRTLHQLNRRPCRPVTRQRISEALRGEQNGQNVLTWQTVAEIRQRYARGIRQAVLSREFHCSAATICAVVHNRRWVSA